MRQPPRLGPSLDPPLSALGRSPHGHGRAFGSKATRQPDRWAATRLQQTGPTVWACQRPPDDGQAGEIPRELLRTSRRFWDAEPPRRQHVGSAAGSAFESSGEERLAESSSGFPSGAAHGGGEGVNRAERPFLQPGTQLPHHPEQTAARGASPTPAAKERLLLRCRF